MKLRNINSQAVSDAIRTIHSLNAPRQTPTLTDQTGRRGRVAHTAPPPAAELEEPTLFVDPAEALPEETDDASQSMQEDTTNNNKPKRKPPTYQFVKDLDLRPQGKQSLREFFAEKKASDQQKQFAVILYYLTDVLGLKNVGANHMYHGFNDVDKKSPLDILQSARLTAKRKGWVDSSDGNNLRMTTNGQNFVRHDLPEKAAADSQE